MLKYEMEGQIVPIYEYICRNCGKIVELLQPMGQNQAGQNCPVCGSADLVKKISAANINRESRGGQAEAGLCCGRNERPSSCVPGGCCGKK
jgi:putative FmdB family regulatory protein